ncbi:MAG: DUF262 domain-containing protein [Ardenticatenaceae bacterium]|nr:DUF262 domain-containing protein [Ardenticatenaceae bacterium]
MAETTSQQTQTIESLDLNLAKIFSDFYIVPSFQREYVWQEEQVEQLLNDIYDEYSDDGQASEYFIGSLVVCPSENDGVLELIDGQQRMTTSYLFLCAVRDHLAALKANSLETLSKQIAATSMNDEGEEVFRYRVNLQYEDSCGLLEQIAHAPINLDSIARTTRSVTNMLNAYQTIRTFLTTEFGNDAASVRKFYAYFTNRVKLVRIKTQSVAHALKVFETINDRGVGLDAMDLLKNLMFMQASKNDFDKLKNNWKDLVDTLYAAKEKPLRFLRYFIFANYEVDRLKEDQIYRWFVENEKLCDYAKNPIAFVDKLRTAATAYVRYVGGQNADGTTNRYLVNIRYLSGAARQHLILLLAGMHLERPDFVELCRQLENLFFAYIITREPTKEFERRFAQWAVKVQKVTTRAELDEFINTTIKPANHNLASRYQLAFEQLHEGAIQKYRMRYVLGKLTQYVNEQAYGHTEEELNKFINRLVDVEHILPKTPSAEVMAEFDKPDEIYDYIHRLGNLTLLERSINSSVGNGLFSAKKEPYHQSKFLFTKSISEKVAVGVNTAIDRAVKDLVTFDEWTSESIEMRQLMLADLAKRVWDMP